jgi:hypothetical protein
VKVTSPRVASGEGLVVRFAAVEARPRGLATMRVEIPAPLLGSLDGKRQTFRTERCHKLQMRIRTAPHHHHGRGGGGAQLRRPVLVGGGHLPTARARAARAGGRRPWPAAVQGPRLNILYILQALTSGTTSTCI